MLQESGRRKFSVVAIVAMITLLLTSAILDAALIAQYRLLDHPGGNSSPPPYGLRLDQLGSFPVPDPGMGLPEGKYLFSAEASRSNLTLDVIEDDMTPGLLSMRIHGTMFGGLKLGDDMLHPIFRGRAMVDFTYREHVKTGSGGVGGDSADVALFTVTEQDHDLSDGNTGTIVWTVSNGDTHTIYLQDKTGEHFSARLAPDHRTPLAPDTLSFWGWVNHSTVATIPDSVDNDYRHFSASDWLLTATVIPEPATVLCLGVGAAAAGLARRRRRRAETEAS